MPWVPETLYDNWAQSFRITRDIVHERSDYQDIHIIDTATHGKVMLLDGVVQITEADEFIYQEMISHVPLVQHGAARKVLIVGAGDGGVLRRVLQHKSVEQVTLVEIDEAVVRLAKTYLPNLGGKSWEDARANVLIADGIAYLRQAHTASVDVIIVDSTDPAGPGESLFTESFYRDCARVLTPGGLLVNQCGVPFMQPDELQRTTRIRKLIFRHVSAFMVAVPTYVGGLMALGIASDTPITVLTPAQINEKARFADIIALCRYWSPSIHSACFALPPFIAQLVGDQPVADPR